MTHSILTFILGRMSYKFVKEQNVINGTALLLRDEVRSIVVVGKYGNSVSSTSRRISETIKKMMDWISLECRYTDIQISVDEKNNHVYIRLVWFVE